MVDQEVPTNQFHPYQAPDATPNSEKPAGGLEGILNKIGVNQASLGGVTERLRNTDVKGSVTKVQDYARMNPGKFLGGLAALVIGAGLMRQRSKAKSLPKV